jgi:hypothetical protein
MSYRVPAYRWLAAFFGVSAASLSFAPLARAQGGDLIYHVGWHAEASASFGIGVGIELQIIDQDSNQLADEWSSGLEGASVDAYADVHARNTPQMVHAREDLWLYWSTIDADWWYYVGYFEDAQELPSAGPGSVTFVTRSFLRYNWIPHPFFPGVIYGGDDREFGYYGGSARLSLVADIYNPGINDGNWLGGPWTSAGLTESYDLDSSLDNLPWLGGRLTQEARDDWETGGDKKLNWGYADVGDSGCDSFDRLGDQLGAWTSSVRLHCAIHGGNPLVPLAPDIDWSFTLTLTFGFDGCAYVLDGERDGFPSYEAYLNGTPILQEQDNGDLWSMFPWGTVSFHSSGVII